MIKVNLNKRLTSPEGPIDLHAEFNMEEGSVLTLFGPSGVGKTSILRMLAGLMVPDDGHIYVADNCWYKNKKSLKPQQRSVGYVFQDYALFPHMTVMQNMMYASGRSGKAELDELVELFELTGLIERTPDTLSGGQMQRVAIARALMRKPALLLLDEPLSALDRRMSYRIQEYLLKLKQNKGISIIYVTHDIGEIFRISDQVIRMEPGRPIEKGTPAELFAYREISGKFQLTGEITDIQKQDVLFVISVLIGNQLVRVVADAATATSLSPGDQVLVASKAFNPVIVPLL